MSTRQHIVEVAQSWIGTPYRHQGRKKGVAIDCIGLVWGVAGELGIHEEIPANYSMSPSSDLLLQGARKKLGLVPDGDLQMIPGRIAVMWGFDRHTAQHFAIVGQRGGIITMIHAFSKRKAVVENTWDTFWLNRLVSMFEFPGVED